MRFLLKIYKQTLSPMIKFLFGGGGCKYYPEDLSCSEYAVESIEKYGIIKGGRLAIQRVLKCNNWSR